jgi:hypothetical protein
MELHLQYGKFTLQAVVVLVVLVLYKDWMAVQAAVAVTAALQGLTELVALEYQV